MCNMTRYQLWTTQTVTENVSVWEFADHRTSWLLICALKYSDLLAAAAAAADDGDGDDDDDDDDGFFILYDLINCCCRS